MKLHGCRFLYFFSLCECQERSHLFGAWTFQPPRGVKQKKPEILALLQEIWLKHLTSRKLFWSSNIYALKLKKIPAAEAYRNGAKLNYVHPSLVLSKIFDRSIYVIATWNSQEKIKSAIPHGQNHTPWLIKNGKTFFSKLMQQISLSVLGKQVASTFLFSNF